MNALDKEEFRIKLEEINRLVEKKDYKDAMEVVDSIDWRRVRMFVPYVLLEKSMQQIKDTKTVRKSSFWLIIEHRLAKIFYTA